MRCRRQPKGRWSCYASPMAGWAPVLLDEWKRWVNYLKGGGKTPSSSESIYIFLMPPLTSGGLGIKTAVLRKSPGRARCSRCGLSVSSWRGGMGDSLMRGAAVCSCHRSDPELRDVFLLHAAISSYSHKEGLQGYSAIVAQNLHSKMPSLLQVMFVCPALLCNLGSGSPPAREWLLYVCRWKSTAVGALGLEGMNTWVLYPTEELWSQIICLWLHKPAWI